MSALTASDVREILKITERPGVISFAGGLPAPELFPTGELAELARELLLQDGARALQYSTTEGYQPLRHWIAERMNSAWGTFVDEKTVLVTTGSQQSLDLTAKVFLDEGDVVLSESPTYLGAIGAFKTFRPRFVEIPSDDDGVVLDGLEASIEGERPKFIYVVPTSQNPSGRTWTLERRRHFMEIVTRHSVPVIEDTAYTEIHFEGGTPVPLKALDTTDCVVTLGTLSKVLSPGLRVGWLVADPALYDKFVIAKQSTDLHTPSLTQMLAARWLEKANFEEHLERIRTTYRVRCEVMLRALETEMPKGVRFTRPKGGMFVWVWLPENVDARALLRRCIAQNVAFVPGAAFFPQRPQKNTMRLNFSNMSPERIHQGVRIIADALAEILEEVAAA
jgi:DNA-binding transcriptional MocR family regulator